MYNLQGRKDTGNGVKGGGHAQVPCLIASSTHRPGPHPCSRDDMGGKPQHPASVLGTSLVSFWNVSCVPFVYMNGLIMWKILEDKVKFQFMTHLWYSKS